jgi:hypothetical protein
MFPFFPTASLRYLLHPEDRRDIDFPFHSNNLLRLGSLALCEWMPFQHELPGWINASNSLTLRVNDPFRGFHLQLLVKTSQAKS